MKQREKLGNMFVPRSKVTQRKKALHDYIKLIVNNKFSLGDVENKDIREFSKHDEVFSRKMVKETMFTLVEIVEKLIADEMKEAGYGAIMHDGWSKFSSHYTALFAFNVLPKKQTIGGQVTMLYEVYLSLLSLSPLCSVVDNDDDDQNGNTGESSDDENCTDDMKEAVNFTAEKHAEHFKHTFDTYYNVVLTVWTVCQIADTAAVNVKVATLLKIAHVSCKNHNLNLEVNYMCNTNNDINNVINSVHETMKQCKQRLTNAALLRSVCNV